MVAFCVHNYCENTVQCYVTRTLPIFSSVYVWYPHFLSKNPKFIVCMTVRIIPRLLHGNAIRHIHCSHFVSFNL